MAIDFDALDLVRTQNKAKMYEQQQKEKKQKDQIYFEPGSGKLYKNVSKEGEAPKFVLVE